MPRPPCHRPSRGQTLVLFGLTLALLCVMVLMTLAIGSKIIEKNDLNHMADTAAYNQAVVVARTFNSISLINRTQVSHMVALSGVQSLISWTGAYRGTIAMLRGQFAKEKSPSKDECDDAAGDDATPKQRQQSRDCGCVAQVAFEAIELPLEQEEARMAAGWDALDAAAAAQARSIRLEAEAMYQEQLALYREEMLKEVGEQKLTARLIDAAKVGQRVPEELSAPRAGGEIALRELGAALDCRSEKGDTRGPGCVPNGPNAHSVWAAMGSRGFAFTTSRAGQAAPFLARLAQILPANVQVSLALTGSAYFADEQVHGMATTSNQMAWADDHVGLQTRYLLATGSSCSKEGGFGSKGDAWVKSAAGGDEHVWPSMTADGLGRAEPTNEMSASGRHTVGIMWPSFIDYNPALLLKPEDSYGQPKTYAVVGRDYALRERLQPWERSLKFSFTVGGGALDLRSNRARVGTTLQTSLASGVAYYHRPGHWKEPPNFLNPFWRATLMATDIVDQDSLDDVPRTLNEAGARDAARSFTALYQAGYRGF